MKRDLQRFFLIIIALLAFFTSLSISFAANDEDAPPSDVNSELKDEVPFSYAKLITSSQLKRKFEREWFKRYEKGADKNKVTEELVDVMLNSGVANLPDFSSALVIEAKSAFKKGLNEEAVALCEQAVTLSPRMSKFYFELSDMHFRDLSIVKGISTYFNAVKVRMRSFMDSMLYNTNLLLFILTIIIIFIVTYTVLIALKYLKLFYHDISHLFPRSLKSTIVRLYTIAMFLLPLLLGLGIFWQFIYLIILGFIYGTKKEKYVFYVIAVLIALIPVITISTLEMDTFINSDEIKNIYQANQGTWYRKTEDNLERRLNKRPDDTDLLLSLGLISKRRRDYNQAEKYYLKGLEINPDSYELNVNLGNVYLAVNNIDKALKQYKKAAEIDPENGTVHYNLNTLYLREVLLDDAATEFQLAMDLSPDIVYYYSEIMNTSSPNFNRMVIDEQVSKKNFKDRYNRYSKSVKGIASKILPFQIKAMPYEKIPLVSAILIVIMIFLHILNKSYAFTSVCQKCGGAVCYKCQRTISDNKLCSQCYYIIVKREGVDPKSRIIKMLQIKNYVTRRIVTSKLLTFIFPGTGHLLKGYTLRGVVFSLLSIIFVLNILYPRGYISELSVTGVNSSIFTFGSYILLFLFIVMYVISLIDIYRSE
jgi:tetratricopeptide (TPR) repeat protein